MASETTGTKSRRTRRNYASGVSGDTKMADEKVKTALVEKQGKTRGKNPRDISYKVLNQVPVSLEEFADVTGVKDEKDFLEYLYEGYNGAQYSAASDEIGEFIPEHWDANTKAQFRLAVRNTSKLTGLDIEQTVNMLLPAIEKAITSRKAEAEAEAAKAKTEEKSEQVA